MEIWWRGGRERIEKENEQHKGIEKHVSLFCSKGKGKQLQNVFTWAIIFFLRYPEGLLALTEDSWRRKSPEQCPTYSENSE